MGLDNVEEQIDILSYIDNTLETINDYLEDISFDNNEYNLIIAQLLEVSSNINNRIDELENRLDNATIEEIENSRIKMLKNSINNKLDD